MTRNLRVGVLFVVLVVGAGRARAGITMTPSTINCGNVVIPNTSAVFTGTLNESGGPPHHKVDLAMGTCTGAGAGTFTVTDTSGATTNLNLNSPVTIDVTYAPTARGTYSCTWLVYDTGTTNELARFTVQGNGQNVQNAMLDATNLTFANVRWNDAAPVHSSTATITMTNTGDATLTVSNVTVDNTTDFAITSGGTTATITGGNTHSWTITFNPMTAGAKTGTLTFQTDDPDNGGVVTASLGSATTTIGTNATISVPATLDDMGIINAGNSSSTNVVVTNNGATTKGPLGVTQAVLAQSSTWFTFTSCPSLSADKQTCTFTPALSINTSQNVPITCSPPANANSGDNQTVTVTFTSDSDTTGNNVQMIKCTAGKSNLQTLDAMNNTLSSLAFSPTLVGGASAAQTVTIKNGGNVSASNITFTVPTNFAISAPCGVAPMAACTLAASGMAGDSVNVDISFHPTAEGGLGGTFQVAGAGVNPSLSLSGRGIDRHISIASMVMFPDTFRYPSASDPAGKVTVMNTGEYPLAVSNISVTDAMGVWMLAQSDTMITVDPLSSKDILVRFAPRAAGKQNNGTLSLMSDDPLMMAAGGVSKVTLTGNGKDRNVTMGPASIDLGLTGAGVPTRLVEVHPGEPLVITNMDPDGNNFHIRMIAMEGDAVFDVTDMDGNSVNNVEIVPMVPQQFDVIFKPPGVGSFRANIALYLDEDPTSQTSIPVSGQAEFVDAHGGGGCSTSGSGGLGTFGLVLGALALGRGLRRRSRALATLVVLIAAPGARAEPTRNIELSIFDPTPTTSGSSLQVITADVGASGTYVAAAIASVASNPLVLGTGGADDPVVSRQSMMSIGGAYAFAGRFEAGAHMPFYVQSGDTVPMGTLGVPPASGAARGALTLHAKAQLVKTPVLRLGLGGSLRLPTQTDSQFAGPEKVSGRVLALASVSLGLRLELMANAGGVLRPQAEFANIVQKSGLAWGVGAAFRIAVPLAFTGEVFGDVIPGGYHGVPPAGMATGATSTLMTIEALGGVRYFATRELSIGVAGGRGLTSGIGTPDLRAVLTFAYVPGAPAQGPVEKPKKPWVPPPIIDPSHGDRDYDRIPDAVDKCPDQAEDKDGFQDEDGCPDPDNDNDGIPDVKDQCPNEAEDKDGFQDDDGCPDPDNDHDGIPDDKDKCPNEPETINGIDDDDGCPDKGDSLIISSPERLELMDSIAFNKDNTISKKSTNMLGQLAATLRARADIIRLRITVHVQPTASPDKDQQLSDKRAAAIKDWLVAWGIKEGRLETKGFGGTKPLVPPSSKGAAAVNDRSELIIIEIDRPKKKH